VNSFSALLLHRGSLDTFVHMYIFRRLSQLLVEKNCSSDLQNSSGAGRGGGGRVVKLFVFV
jgi:hypothetical protein